MALEDIKRNLIASDSLNLPRNLIAAAVQISEEGIAEHAGIVIKNGDSSYLFHYGGEEVELIDIPQGDWYFHKDLIFVEGVFSSSFLAYCEIIKEFANPHYAFFYNGSFYTDRVFFSNIENAEYMSCVGFCLNVLKGFLDEDYITFTDWGVDTVESEAHRQFVADFIVKIRRRFPTAQADELIENIRRISPDEYLASAYIQGVPISKGQIDEIILDVREALVSKLD